MRQLVLVLCILFAASVWAQPYAIGHRTITFTDPTRNNRQIATEIYYPAATGGDNVAITGNNYPVVVFGHGFVMSWDAYQNVWEDLVPLGYVVCFPKTEGGIPPSHGDFGLDLAFVAENMQQRNTTDASFFFYQKLAPTTALMGHSMGGGAAHLAAANNTNITCLATFAPAETNPSAVTAAAGITVPTLTLAGANDCVTPIADHAGPIYNGIGSKCKTMVVLTGASHCQFGESNFNCNFGEATCSPGPSISRAQQHTTQASYYVPFLNKYLKGICSTNSNFESVLTAGVGATTIQRTCMAQPGNSVTVCPNTPVNLGSTTMDGYTFSWASHPSGFSSNAQVLQVSPNVTTTYILTYTNQQSNCSVVDSVTVNIPISAANAGNNATICPNDTATLGQPAIPNYSYSWTSNPSGFTASSAQIAVNPNANTQYYLTVIGGNCTLIDTASVTIAAAPVATITPSGPTTFCAGQSVNLFANGGFAFYNWSTGQTSQSITVTESGTFKVVVSNNSSCIDTSDAISVVVKPSPAPVISPNGPTTFCSGNNVTLTVDTGFANYVWGPVLSISNEITVNESGNYIVIVSNANGCTGSDTIAVTVYPHPTVTIALVNDTLFATGSNGGDNYFWTFQGMSLLSHFIVPVDEGEYQVLYTDANGCSAAASYIYTKTGNNETLAETPVQVYPNPATTSIFISAKSAQSLNAYLYNYTGQMVFSLQKSAQKLTEIDLNGLKSGIYLLKIEQNGIVSHHKIIKL